MASTLGRTLGIVSLTCVVAVAVLAPEGARGGEFGIPCGAGSSSPNGFEPCSLCPAGTFQPVSGADVCNPVPEGTWAPQGSSTSRDCACADEPLCTIDRCSAATGACTTHEPAPGCEAYQVRAVGTVTETEGEAAGIFAIGAPFVASWIVDPAELDRRSGPSAGAYPYAIRDVAVRVGEGASAIAATADFERLFLESTPPRTSDYLDFGASLAVPGWQSSSFYLTLSEGDDPAITSDAIPTAFPSPSSFAFRELGFSLIDTALVRAISVDFVLTSPEPASGLGAVAIGALFALRRRRVVRS